MKAAGGHSVRVWVVVECETSAPPSESAIKTFAIRLNGEKFQLI